MKPVKKIDESPNKVKRTAVTLVLASFVWFSPYASAQICNAKQIAQTVSPKSFTFNEIVNMDSTTPVGTATATETATTINAIPGLIWQKCVYGQKWNSATSQCIGSPMLLSWPEALKIADGMQSIIDGNIWRIPNIKELKSILELQCVNPPFNLDIFPDTFASEEHGLWTSSPHVNNLTPNTNAWYIDLSQGKLNFRDVYGEGPDAITTSTNTKNFVRFVR